MSIHEMREVRSPWESTRQPIQTKHHVYHLYFNQTPGLCLFISMEPCEADRADNPPSSVHADNMLLSVMKQPCLQKVITSSSPGRTELSV